MLTPKRLGTRAELDLSPEPVARGRPHLIQGYKVAPVEHGCKGEAMAWFAANYKKEEEECVLQELKDQDPGIIVCPQKLPSNQWICPGCERRTRQWDVFFSPTLKGWGRYVRCSFPFGYPTNPLILTIDPNFLEHPSRTKYS